MEQKKQLFIVIRIRKLRKDGDLMDIEKIKNASCIYISSLEYDSFYYEKDEKQRRLDWIKKADRFSQCLIAVNKGNRFDYLNWLHKGDLITDQECADAVYSIWTMQERFYRCGMSKEKLVKMIKLAEKSPLLQSDLDDLSDQNIITIYQGVKVNNYRGLSWTVDKSVAEWFARRFGHDGDKCYVFTGTINKKDIIALFSSRNEKEVVCDYRKIKNILCEEIVIADNPESKFDKHIEMCIEGE